VTTTLAGTPAATVLLLASVTSALPAGAAEVNVTVPVEEAPPATLLGLSVTEERALAGVPLSVIVADWLTPYVPVIVTTVVVATGDVVTLNVANPCPAGTVTLAGTFAAALLLVNVTTAPPAGAAALSVSET